MSNIDKQTREELRKRYTPPEIPKCKICGSELSIQRCGGGEPTVYACDGYEADPENPGMVRRAAGRDIADKHYEESRYIDWKKGGDSDVVALLDELEAKDKALSAQDNHINQQADRIESLEKKNGELGRALGAAEKRIAELEAGHNNLREAMAGIHNTIRGEGAYTPLAAILNASKRAYEESAAAAGKGE